MSRSDSTPTADGTDTTEPVEIAIAPVTFDGWPRLLQLLHAAFESQHDRIAPPSSLWQLDAEKLAAKARDETLLLATRAGTVVGCLFARRVGDALFIGKFAVEPTQQKLGVGHRLVAAAERHARSLGLAALALDTRIELAENHATFTALGFVEVGQHAHAGFDRPTYRSMRRPLRDRASELIAQLQLAPHPEGGWYRELFRSSRHVQPDDERAGRSALTSIDFLLTRGQCSAWHRVRSDEAWHLLEGSGLRLWLLPPALDVLQAVTLGVANGRGCTPRHVVPAGWWQAAEPLGEHAYVGATVGPGFDFADFDFMRDDVAARAALLGRAPSLARLL